MKKLAMGMVAMLVIGAAASVTVNARAGAVIEDDKPVPFRTAQLKLDSKYVLSSGASVNPGSYILEVTLIPAVQPSPVHGAVIQELVVNFYEVEATRVVFRGSQKATIEVTKPEAGRKYSLSELGFAHGHPVALRSEQGSLHGALTGKNAVIRFALAPAPAAH